jgi:hypothetical protein
MPEVNILRIHKRYDVDFIRGEGSYLFDVDGKNILIFMAELR